MHMKVNTVLVLKTIFKVFSCQYPHGLSVLVEKLGYKNDNLF